MITGVWRMISLVAVLLAGQSIAQEVVTVDNFTRAETDHYLQKRADDGYFGRIKHIREMVPLDNQPVVRANRDTLYSYGVFDLSTPVTITMPATEGRFQSLRVIDQDHYIVQNTYEPLSYTFTQKEVGTRYLYVAIRTLADPENAQDMATARALQDAIVWEQAEVGKLELPDWDQDLLDAVRAAILEMAPYVPDSARMFGAKDEVDEVRHLIGTAGGWAGGPDWASYYINVTPEVNDGAAAYALTVRDVPVDGFWSISVYNAEGYFQESERGGYSVNNLTAARNADDSITVHFGGDPEASNYLSIMPGWNYTVRLYRSRPEVLDGSWTFPEAQLVQ